jgi:outer membrane receptor protein involved in Fe transport
MSNQDHFCSQFTAKLNPVSAAVSIAVGAVTVVAMPASAQQEVPVPATSGSDGLYEEILVTATRRSVSVQDVPYNIAAFSGDALQKQRINDMSEFARWVPGLTLTDQGARGASTLSVRGLNASQLGAPESTLGNSNGGTVATYVGEVPLYIDLKPLDIDRVEVLIGPQGTLYGAGTLGGAVRYIPNAPDPTQFTIDTHANVNSKAHSSDLGYDFDAAINIPLINDVLAFRGVVGYMHDAGFVDANYLVQEAGISDPEPAAGQQAANLKQYDDVDDQKTLSLRGTLLWNINEDFSTTLAYYYQDQDVGGRTINHQASFGTGEYESAHRFKEPQERKNHLVNLVFDGSFEVPGIGPVQSVTSLGYSRYKETGNRDQTDLLLNFEYGYEDFPSFSAYTFEDVDSEDTTTIEQRFVSQADSKWNWIVGGFYRKEKTDFDSSEEFAPCLPTWWDDPNAVCDSPDSDFAVFPDHGDLEYWQLDESELKEKALFGELGYQLTDRWQTTVGIRWYDFENTAETGAILPFLGDTEADFDPLDSATSDDDGVTFKVNLSVDMDGWLTAMDSGTSYFTFSQGYRVGGPNFVPACNLPFDPTQQNVCGLPNEVAFKPDTTDNYEIGMKTTWLDNRLTVNADVFLVTWDDVQTETITVNGALPITGNASTAQTHGLEMMLRAQITDNLSVYGSYAYTKAELTADAIGAVGTRFGTVDAFDGDRLPGSPENQGAFNVNYTHQFLWGTTLDLDYGFTSISNVFTKIGNRGSGETLSGFTLHNAAATMATDVWSATLYVDNLTDKFASTGVRADTDFIDTIGPNDFTLRRYYHNIIQPRTAGLDVRYNFAFAD